MIIPKIIHYCWFGGNEKPAVVKKCIESWKKVCPNWEIREWNEENFDVNVVPYMKEAYDVKKWAFVSDIARLLVIYQYGGVYLDTDVELLESIDVWTEKDAFFIFESNRNIASGLGFGAEKGHKAIKAMLNYYEGKHFIINGKAKLIPCPAGNTNALVSEYKNFERNGLTQYFDGIQVLSYSDYSQKAFHYGTATWVENKEIRKSTYKETRLKLILRDYRAFKIIEKCFGKKVVDIYTFIAYDLMEMGIWYYFKRIFF